jgi:hypothetical protein
MIPYSYQVRKQRKQRRSSTPGLNADARSQLRAQALSMMLPGTGQKTATVTPGRPVVNSPREATATPGRPVAAAPDPRAQQIASIAAANQQLQSAASPEAGAMDADLQRLRLMLKRKGATP